MRSFTLILPFKLPTWNQLLAMNRWERAKVRHWIHQFVLDAIQRAKDLETVTVVVLRPSWTPLLQAEYYRLIRPKASLKYLLRKSLTMRTKQRSRSKP